MSDQVEIDDNKWAEMKSQIESAKAELASTEKPKEESKAPESVVPTVSETETHEPAEAGQEFSDTEKEAMKQGWNPHHKGPNAKSAEQFMHDGSFFKKIESQSNKINELGDLVKNLLEHNRKLEEVRSQRSVAEAAKERDAAIESGDINAFRVADEQLKQQLELSQSLKPKAPEIPAEIQQELKSFQEKHKSWFLASDKESQEMTKLAMAFDTYNIQNGINQLESIAEVEKIIKFKFPHRFENPKQAEPAAVLKSSPSSSGGKSSLIGKMTDQQKWMFNEAKRYDKNLSLDTYAKQLKDIGALKDE